MSVSLDFFCFIAFPGGSQRWEFKNVVQKIVSKSFTKENRPKIQNRCFLDFFNHVFGRFSIRGVQKSKTHKPGTCPFLVSNPPTTHHGGRQFLFAGPLVSDSSCKLCIQGAGKNKSVTPVWWVGGSEYKKGMGSDFFKICF
jgi:hypothetical protein